MTDRRSFVAWLGSLPLVGRRRPLHAAPPIVIDATPTALYQQPDGRNNLVRVAVSGVGASGSLRRGAGPSTGSRRVTPTSASPRCRKKVLKYTAGIWTRRWPACP